MEVYQKLVAIEAVQLIHNEKISSGYEYKGFFREMPEWLKEALRNGIVELQNSHEIDYGFFNVYFVDEYGQKKLTSTIYPNDWVIRNPDGKVYGCRAKLFHFLYDI
jgi:hypothetical protein